MQVFLRCKEEQRKIILTTLVHELPNLESEHSSNPVELKESLPQRLRNPPPRRYSTTSIASSLLAVDSASSAADLKKSCKFLAILFLALQELKQVMIANRFLEEINKKHLDLFFIKAVIDISLGGNNLLLLKEYTFYSMLAVHGADPIEYIAAKLPNSISANFWQYVFSYELPLSEILGLLYLVQDCTPEKFVEKLCAAHGKKIPALLLSPVAHKFNQQQHHQIVNLFLEEKTADDSLSLILMYMYQWADKLNDFLLKKKSVQVAGYHRIKWY